MSALVIIIAVILAIPTTYGLVRLWTKTDAKASADGGWFIGDGGSDCGGDGGCH